MRRLILALLLVMAAGAAQADRWSVPTDPVVKASSDARTLVRVMPADPKAEDGHAIAEWHRFNGSSYDRVSASPLLNRVAPVDIAVSNHGALVTLDNWGGLGHGKVVVLYAADGSVMAQYQLDQLYSASDMKRLPWSLGSIRWRCGASPAWIRDSDHSLFVPDSLGGMFTFDLDSGKFQYRSDTGSCPH